MQHAYTDTHQKSYHTTSYYLHVWVNLNFEASHIVSEHVGLQTVPGQWFAVMQCFLTFPLQGEDHVFSEAPEDAGWGHSDGLGLENGRCQGKGISSDWFLCSQCPFFILFPLSPPAFLPPISMIDYISVSCLFCSLLSCFASSLFSFLAWQSVSKNSGMGGS